MKHGHLTSVLLSAAMLLTAFRLTATDFVDHGPAPKFVEIDVHLIGGGSGMTQNYGSKFAEIREVSSSMGGMYGVGAGAVFGMNSLIGLGTELNFTFNENKTDVAVSNDDVTSVSNVFLTNRYVYGNIPVYIQFRFNLSESIRWTVNAGMYYSYGLGGKQKQTIYNSTVNELGQLVPRVVETKPDFFHSDETFINAFNRSDIGLHLATGLNFGRHIMVGVRLQAGFKNISRASGIVNPDLHNLSLAATLGYRF